MQDVAQRWEAMVLQEGGTLGFVEGANEGSLSVTNNEQNYYYDEDDDDGGEYIRLFRDIVKRNYYVFK
jgi:hypothetical protein